VQPHWQKMQSNEQVLNGVTSIPSERPSRRDRIGPKRYLYDMAYYYPLLFMIHDLFFTQLDRNQAEDILSE
jgi:hypothetical protein